MAVGQPEKKSSCLKILLGCGIVLVVLCGGGITLAVIFFPKVKEWFETQVAKVQEWEAFAENWDPPPADADTDRLFPDRVADFRRQDVQKVAAPQPGIDLAGSQASYQSGAETMEAFAYQANQAEKNAAFQQFEKAQQQGGKKWFFKLDLPHHSRANFTHGQEHGVLWWSQDWLFLVRTTGQGDPEAFLRSYLEAIAEPAHAPEKPGKPEKPAKGGGEF
jgi:hypothetical protein